MKDLVVNVGKANASDDSLRIEEVANAKQSAD
jgi:hypothetical protein